MKFFLKISFFILILFNFFGDYAGKVVREKWGMHKETVISRHSSQVNQVSNIPQMPLPLKVFRRFQNGIDETFVSISEPSNRVLVNIDLSLNDICFYQSWVKHYCMSCQAMPGYKTHLSSLPLRSPPFSC